MWRRNGTLTLSSDLGITCRLPGFYDGEGDTCGYTVTNNNDLDFASSTSAGESSNTITFGNNLTFRGTTCDGDYQEDEGW